MTTALIVVSGQSLASRQFADSTTLDGVETDLENLGSITGGGLGEKVRTGEVTVTTTTDNSLHLDNLTGADLLAIRFMEAHGDEYDDVIIVNAARGGRPILQESARYSGHGESFFDETILESGDIPDADGSGAFDGTLMRDLVKPRIDQALAGRNDVDFIGVVWAQGEADARTLGLEARTGEDNNPSENAYRAGLKYTLNEMISYVEGNHADKMTPNSSPAAFIQHLGRRTYFDDGESNGLDDIKNIQEEIANSDDRIFLATDSYDLDLTRLPNTVHTNAVGSHLAMERMSQFIAGHDGGPRISGFQITNGENEATITFDLEQNGWTDIQFGADAKDLLLVRDDGPLVPAGSSVGEQYIPVSDVRIDGGRLVFTLSRALTLTDPEENGTLAYAYSGALSNHALENLGDRDRDVEPVWASRNGVVSPLYAFERTFTMLDLGDDSSTGSIEADMSAAASDTHSDLGQVSFDRGSGEVVVNTLSTGEQQFPSIVTTDDNRILAVWNSIDPSVDYSPKRYPSKIRARIVEEDGSSGSIVAGGSDYIQNSTFDSVQLDPAVTRLENGSFLTVWRSRDELGIDQDGYGIRARIFTQDGRADLNAHGGKDFVVNTTTADQQVEPDVAALSFGGALVVWHSTTDDLAKEIRARVIEPDGSSLAGDFLVNSSTGSHSHPTVAGLLDGRAVVAWVAADRAGADTSGTSIRGRIYDAGSDGTLVPSGPDFIVNDSFHSDQRSPAIATLPDGRFVVTWRSLDRSEGDTDLGAIRARVFDEDGVADPAVNGGRDFLVNTTVEGDQAAPDIMVLDDGRLFFVWQSDDRSGDGVSETDIRGRVFNPDGTPDTRIHSGVDFIVNLATDREQLDPSVTRLDGNKAAVAWWSFDGEDPDGSGIKMRTLDLGFDSPDTTAPDLIRTGPENGELVPGDPVILTFDEAIRPESGAVLIRRLDDRRIVDRLDIGTEATIDGSTLELASDKLLIGESYYVHVPNHTVEDYHGNGFGGFASSAVAPFTVVAPEVLLTDAGIADGDTNVAADAPLRLVFNQDIEAGEGEVVIRRYRDKAIVDRIDIAGETAIENDTIVFSPKDPLVAGIGYYLQIDAGAVINAYGGAFAGLSRKTDFDFKTAPPIRLTDAGLADDDTNINAGAPIELVFNQGIEAGEGEIIIRRYRDKVIVDRIDAAREATVENDTLIFSPKDPLIAGIGYYLQIDAGAIVNADGAEFGGITNKTKLNFKTAVNSADDTWIPSYEDSSFDWDMA